VYDTHDREQKTYIYSQLNCLSSQRQTKVAGICWEILLSTQRTYCAQPSGITLILYTQIEGPRDDQAGRLVLIIGGKSLKTSSRDFQAQVHSDQMVLVIARREASLCEQSPK
jgi:hypothetical protein